MKTTVIRIGVLLVAAGAAGALLTAQARLRRDIDRYRAERLDAERGMRAAQGDLTELRGDFERVARQSVTLSNRVTETIAQLQREQDTHEPLRRQIESMLADQIRQAAEVGDARKRVETLEAAHGAAVQKAQALETEKQQLQAALDSLRADHAQELAGQQKQLDGLKASSDKERTELGARIHELEAGLAAADKARREAETRLAEEESRLAAADGELREALEQNGVLKAELEALRQQFDALKQAADKAAAGTP